MSSISALAYLLSGVCFILALRGLASPETARQGNLFGVFGMGVAIVTTLFLIESSSFWLIAVAVALGGGIGAVVGRNIKMTALRELGATFHSLVGLAAVLVSSAAFLNPDAYGIMQGGSIQLSSLI